MESSQWYLGWVVEVYLDNCKGSLPQLVGLVWQQGIEPVNTAGSCVVHMSHPCKAGMILSELLGAARFLAYRLLCSWVCDFRV